MALRQSTMAANTTNDTKHSVDKQIARLLYYALTFHMANHPEHRKIVETFSNHCHYLHLMSAFFGAVHCKSQSTRKRNSSETSHFDTECYKT